MTFVFMYKYNKNVHKIKTTRHGSLSHNDVKKAIKIFPCKNMLGK